MATRAEVRNAINGYSVVRYDPYHNNNTLVIRYNFSLKNGESISHELIIRHADLQAAQRTLLNGDANDAKVLIKSVLNMSIREVQGADDRITILSDRIVAANAKTPPERRSQVNTDSDLLKTIVVIETNFTKGDIT